MINDLDKKEIADAIRRVALRNVHMMSIRQIMAEVADEVERGYGTVKDDPGRPVPPHGSGPDNQ